VNALHIFNSFTVETVVGLSLKSSRHPKSLTFRIFANNNKTFEHYRKIPEKITLAVSTRLLTF